MAEAVLKKLAGDWFEVFRAGYDRQGINPLTRKDMAEISIDLSSRFAKGRNF